MQAAEEGRGVRRRTTVEKTHSFGKKFRNDLTLQ